MKAPQRIPAIVTDEDGGIFVFWAFAMVAFLGFAAIIFDLGRMSNVQSELQSYSDAVALAAAAELDGRADSITRAQSAANNLIADTQTFADEANVLVASNVVTLTFYSPSPDGNFLRDPSLETINPHNARYVSVLVADHTVSPGFAAAMSSIGDLAELDGTVSARAAAGFSLEACNVQPVAMCLPTVNFDASTSIGTTLDLSASVNLGTLLPGNIAVVNTVTNLLDGLEICVGLLGDDLSACLLAAREPETACTGQGGLVISADVSGTELLDSLNTRFGLFSGIASGLAGDPDFSGAPNVLTGLTNALGLCEPIGGLLGAILGGGGSDDISFPGDDCLLNGGCAIQGDANWTLGRQAYTDAHYDGTDPHPTATTRFEFYQAEVAASISGPSGGGGGLLGGLLGGLGGQLCAPQTDMDPTRRLMVVAGIDCLSANVDASVTVPPVQEFFEVFALGPGESGGLQVEISACLGGGCGGGNLDTEIHDIVRLVE